MMNINVKSPNFHIKYLPNTKKIDPTLNSKFALLYIVASLRESFPECFVQGLLHPQLKHLELHNI